MQARVIRSMPVRLRHLRLTPHLQSFSSAGGRYRVASIFDELPLTAASELVSEGYAVVDNFIPKSSCRAIRNEIDALAEIPSALKGNETIFVTPSGDKKTFSKGNIHEAELHVLDDRCRSVAPTLDALQHDSSLAATLSCFQPSMTLSETAVKAQVNSGNGGCFPIHTDSDPLVDHRVVTVLLYVNEEWRVERDGGALRLYPFPPRRCQEGGPVRHVDIAPVEGRAVLLSSTDMHHRVLPSFSKRYCVTLWLSGRISPRAAQRNTVGEECDDLRQILCLPAYRKHVARVAFADEWARSFEEAHDASQAEVAKASHMEEVSKIRAAIAKHVGSKFHAISSDYVSHVLRSPETVMKFFEVE